MTRCMGVTPVASSASHLIVDDFHFMIRIEKCMRLDTANSLHTQPIICRFRFSFPFDFHKLFFSFIRLFVCLFIRSLVCLLALGVGQLGRHLAIWSEPKCHNRYVQRETVFAAAFHQNAHEACT